MRAWAGRHKVATSLLSIVLVFAVGVGGFAFWLNSRLDDITRIPVTIAADTRPADPAPADDEGASDLDILVLGADAGSDRNADGRSILQDAASSSWPAGKYRSDAIMLVNISADRDQVTVMSIPRDSYVDVHDDTGKPVGKNKINAALSLYGPNGAISTVENLTDVRVDHVAMLDWDGFRAITEALGGVAMTTDEGTRTYSGDEALDYVRERKTVAGGDLGRIKRQQNFLRAILRDTLSTSTVTNPVTLGRTVGSVARNLAVDEGWSDGDIRSLAFSMRTLRSGDVRFLTVPTSGTADDPEAGSIVVLDTAGGDELYDAVRAGTLDAYVQAHPELGLPAPAAVD